MDKLIHTVEGVLEVEDPYKKYHVVGTRLGYAGKGSRKIELVGLVTQEALDYSARQDYNKPSYVWAAWGNVKAPAYINADTYHIYIVREDGSIIE